MPLQGMRELMNRLEAVGRSLEPIGDDWASRTANSYSDRVRRNTGRLSRSFRPGDTRSDEATVVGHYTSRFEDKGAKPHRIRPKKAKMMRFEKRGRAVFARAVRHPGMRGTGFIDDGAERALERVPMADIAIRQWNGAA